MPLAPPASTPTTPDSGAASSPPSRTATPQLPFGRIGALREQVRPTAYAAGVALAHADRVALLETEAMSAKAEVTDWDDAHFITSLDWAEPRLRSRCDCPSWGAWDDHCPHAVALAAFIAPDEVPPLGTSGTPSEPVGMGPPPSLDAGGELAAVDRWLGLTPSVLHLGIDLLPFGNELRVGLYRTDKRRPLRFLALSPELKQAAPAPLRPLLTALEPLPLSPDGRSRVPLAASGALLKALGGLPIFLDGEPVALSREPAFLIARWEPATSTFSLELRVGGQAMPLDATQFIGLLPVHALLDGNLHPIEAPLTPGQLLHFQETPVLALPGKTGAAFDRAAQSLQELGIVLEGFQSGVQAPPAFVLTLEGGIDSVRALLASRYGGTELPIAQTLPSAFTAVGGVLIQRDLDREREAVRVLLSAGLTPEGDAFTARGDRAVAFWLEGVKLLPNEWTYYGPTPKKVARIRALTPKLNVRHGLGSEWFRLELDFSAQDPSIDLGQIRSLLAAGRRYIKLSDGSVGELSEALVAALTPMFDETSMAIAPPSSDQITPTLGYSLTAASSIERLASAVPETVLDPTVEKLFNAFRDPAGIEPVPLPEGIKAELRPYQKQGYDWLAFLRRYGLCGILADEMGLGKTLQTLAHLAYLKETEGHQVNLVIAPTSLLTNWEREAARFVPGLKTMIYEGPTRASKRRKLAECDLVVTSYAILRRDIHELEALTFRYVVLDEAQHVKNPASLGAQAVRALKAESRLVLTGTPIENRLFDLWSLFQFLMPGYLGNETTFRQKYVTPIELQNDREARDRLKRRVKPLLLRRLKSDVAKDLPPKTETVVTIDLTPGQQTLYRDMLETARQRVQAIIDARGFTHARVAISAELLRLRQLCNDPRLLKLPPGTQLPPSAKLEAFAELVRDLIEEGHRTLVFSQFTEMLAHLCHFAEAESLPYEYLDGSTIDRQARIDRFNTEGGPPLFFISLKAGGFGLNLTAADYVIHFDPWWNPAAEDQATDRAHRIGQTRPVFSYKIITRGTVEEKILALQAKKKSLAADVLGDEESLTHKLTEADVAALFS